MDIFAQIDEQEVSTDGSIPQGFLFASVKNVGNEIALVNGVELPPGEAKAYPFVGKGYQGVAYETNGTALRILVVV